MIIIGLQKYGFSLNWQTIFVYFWFHTVESQDKQFLYKPLSPPFSYSLIKKNSQNFLVLFPTVPTLYIKRNTCHSRDESSIF
ncbi:hypothetical protein B5E50_12820 [Bacteroides xylanisolvens]|nr:hypothetical protein B5E50_12820 [Bacteroides xylanisolvens]